MQPMMNRVAQPQEASSEASEGGETTTLSEEKYPQLKGLKPGTEVSGSWTGKIQASDNGQVTIAYTDLQIQGANRADKEYERLTGGKGAKPVSNDPKAEEDSDGY